MSDFPHVPPTPVNKPKEPENPQIESLVDQIVAYSELVRRAALYLDAHKRLTEKIAFQFTIELKLLGNILKSMMNVPHEAIKERLDKLDKEGTLDAEVTAFANYIAPVKSVLIQPGDAVNEFLTMKKAGKAPWAMQ